MCPYFNTITREGVRATLRLPCQRGPREPDPQVLPPQVPLYRVTLAGWRWHLSKLAVLSFQPAEMLVELTPSLEWWRVAEQRGLLRTHSDATQGGVNTSQVAAPLCGVSLAYLESLASSLQPVQEERGPPNESTRDTMQQVIMPALLKKGQGKRCAPSPARSRGRTHAAAAAPPPFQLPRGRGAPC